MNMARETLDVRCNSDGSWSELIPSLSRVVRERGRGVFKACYRKNGRNYVRNMTLIDMSQNIRISPKIATVSAARNLKVGDRILGLANFDSGLTKWFDCRVLSRPIVSERGVWVEVQWQTAPFVNEAHQIKNKWLYTELSSIRILNTRDVFTNGIFRRWTEEFCSIVPAQETPALNAQNTFPQSQFSTPVARVLEGGSSSLIPADLWSRSDTIQGQVTGTVLSRNSYVPIPGPRMEFRGPFQPPGRPSAVSWNPIPRIPQSHQLSPSLRGNGGVAAVLRREQNLLPSPAPIRLQTPLSPPRTPVNNGQQEPRTERPDLASPTDKLETIVIADDSGEEEKTESNEKDSAESKEEEQAQAGQSRKRTREEGDTPTFRHLNKFGLFLLAMQWEKPGFNAEEWIAKQKGTLAVMKVDEDE